ncbi:MAG: nascent polypeptide-associated complex protein [Spirochaetes bacterium]|nr:MAG: nascent polypeptide-associated complex protein [Thermoplasmata archaeon]RKX96816.1 MAG: nascent polypeptide-associated complex protein [Spirochaetota bacterium]
MMPNVDPRQLKKMMQRMGMSVEEIENVEEVVIKTPDREYIFRDAEVTVMNVKGQKTYQISGKPEIVEKASEEDAKLVAEKTGKSIEEAKKALEEANGDIAQAIINLSS